MLYTRNAFYFRKFYKEKVAKEKYPIDLNYIGSTSPGENDDGFAKLIYGNRKDLGKLLGTIALNVAADDQAIYELIQNADDCKSSFFSVSYNEDYLLCINNGNYFSDRDMSAIINVAGNYKDGEDIGTFGIGFKILHRLVGADDGREAIINDYAGPIIFSWNKSFQLDAFLEDDEIKVGFDLKKDSENPWLVKLLYTCFPSHLDEKLKLQDYNTEGIKFSKNELSEMRTFLKQSLQNVNLKDTNNLKSGSIFFLKLGKGKSKFLDEGIDKIKSGLSYSFKFLNSLQKIYINGEEIKAQAVLDYSHSFPIGSNEFNEINPKNKNRDIKFTFAFYEDYRKASDLQNKLAPNLYTFFSMDEENIGFSFLLHCNAFDMSNNRRHLQTNSQINQKLLPLIGQKIIEYSNMQKDNDRNKFLSLYANFLLSKEPDGKPHINNSFYKFIHQYISENIPTKNNFSDDAQKVKIKRLKLNLDLANFGLSHIEWFEWDNEADNLLIDEATKKLDIKEWDIRHIIENAPLVNINNWIASCNNETYEAFLKELEESNLRKETIEKLYSVKLFKFSDGNFYSVNDIWVTKNFTETYRERTYNQYNHTYEYINKTRDVQKKVLNQSIHFTINKTDSISNELQNLGFTVSLKNITTYTKIYSAIADKLPTEKDIYNSIAEKCKTNTLSAKEKKKLFLNFINEETKFDNVAEGTLKDLCLFCDAKDNIKPLSELLDSSLRTPAWLNPYKIKTEEHFKGLSPYLIQEEDLFDKIILPNIEIIKEELTEAKEIKELVTFFKENHRSFFNEYIIKKQTNDYEIIDKSDKFQIIPPKDERKTFIDFIENYLSDELIVLPYDFSDFNDQDGILKGEKLHSQILELVVVDEHKETLVDIIHYDEPKRKFLQKLTEFRFNSETEYTKDDYQYKILDLACSELKERSDIQKFREKVVIVTEQGERRLSEISLANDRVKINNKEFSLSKILPATHQNSNLVGDLISLFTKQGISNDKLNALFGVNEALDLNDTFKKFTEQVQTFANPEQFFFLIYYNKYIEKVDLSKLGFDLNCAVFPSEFALEKEKLPEYVQNWITKKEIDLSELDEIGVFTENSALVSLRKFFLSQTDFNINTIAEKLSSNELMLLNTFELLKEKGIELSTDNEFSVFKEIVRVINTSRTDNAKLKEKEERYDFQRLEQNSTQDKTIKGYTIYLYNSQMPNLVQLNEMGDYVFYRYNSDDFAVNGNKIYINDVADRNNVLMQVATYLNDNEFTVSLFGSQNNNDEIEKLRAENKKLKDEKAKNNQKESGNETENPNSSFLDEVKDFIAELEETNWNNYVPELKNLLLDFNNQPEEKRNLFNLIAKIKLTKEKNVKFEESDEGYNVVKIGDEKYFVHSARGAFAYIHPSELLKMKNDGYRMGIDFGKKFKIYENVEDIFELNKVHLLAYQSQNTTEDLLSFCQANRDANKHLLIIDKDNASEKSQALLKLLNNIEDDYQ